MQPKLYVKERHIRTRFVFFILAIEYDGDDPIVFPPGHCIRCKELVAPDGSVVESPNLCVVGEFGHITEHSKLEVIYRVDLRHPLLRKPGVYKLILAQEHGGRYFGPFVELKVVSL